MERTKSFILSSKIHSYNLAQVCTFQPMAREYNYIFLFLNLLFSQYFAEWKIVLRGHMSSRMIVN